MQLHDIDILYDMCELEQTTFDAALDELVGTLYVQKVATTDDKTYYSSRQGLCWSDVVHIDCPAKKQILLCLIENPTTFFVLYNTQKGKLRIAAMEIHSWATVPEKRVVAFLMVDNDKTLADQSAEGIFEAIGSVGKKYLLSSSTSDNVDTIKNKIDSYAAFGEEMPVIVFLNNSTQIAKVQILMKHIQDRMTSGKAPALRYGIVFDEADKVYPACRSKFANFIVNDVRALHRLGFVTATEGDLLEEEYPECANAYMYPVPPGHPSYRAFHTEDAVIKTTVHRAKDNNDAYAELILSANREHFNGTVMLKNGTQGFRKVIVNSAAKRSSMAEFARRRNAEDAHAVTVNMNGICVYSPGREMKKYPTKGKKFGELLFDVCKNLHDKPLFIIGRRKVDRGLGFHWAPTDESDGLIWTDMILGRIEDKNSASQKAGRLAGKVAHCPQYPGKLTWWTDESTARLITRHNSVVDGAGEKRGCSVLQAVTRADADEPIATVPTTAKYAISDTFDTCDEAKEWCGANLTYGSSAYVQHGEACKTASCAGCGTTHIKYRGEVVPLFLEDEVRNQYANTDRSREGVIKGARIMPVTVKDSQQWGANSNAGARIMPVTKLRVGDGVHMGARIMPVGSDPLRWIVFYRIDKLRTSGDAPVPIANNRQGVWSEERKRKAAETRARNKAAKAAAM
jgi:hypothetical protein